MEMDGGNRYIETEVFWNVGIVVKQINAAGMVVIRSHLHVRSLWLDSKVIVVPMVITNCSYLLNFYS